MSSLLPTLCILVVLSLWAYGRYQRSRWSVSPEVRFERRYGTAPGSTAVIVLTGAFNGPPHTRQIVRNHWRFVGDTYVVDYALRRFDMAATVKAAYKCVARKKQYEQVFVVGYSLGGLISLCLLRYARLYDPELAEKLRLLPSDAPLGTCHLRIPGGGMVPPKLMKLWLALAALVHFVHLGPLFNRLSRWVAKVMFVPAPVEMHDPRMDKQLLQEHMAFLRGNKLSLVIEQIAAITQRKPFTRAELGDTPVFYLQCGDGSQPDALAMNGKLRNNPGAPDKVILGDAAREDWRGLFPAMGHAYVGPNTTHVAVVEGWRAWEDASREGTKALLS